MKSSIVAEDQSSTLYKKYPRFAESFLESLGYLMICNALLLLASVVQNPYLLTLKSLGFISIFSFIIPALALYLFTSRNSDFFKNLEEHPFLISSALFTQAGILWFTQPEIAVSMMSNHTLFNAGLIFLWIIFPFLPRKYRLFRPIGEIYTLPAALMYFSLGIFAIFHAIHAFFFVADFFGIVVFK